MPHIVAAFGLVCFIALLVLIGIYCLLFPKKIQIGAAKSVSTGITAHFRPLRNYAASQSYLVMVRLVGVGALIMAVFIGVAEYWSRT